MASMQTVVLLLGISFPVVVCQNNNDYNEPPNNSPDDDPGHNSHQETVIFACLGVTVVMVVMVIVLLWFFVDRTKQTVRMIEQILPEIIERFKNGEIGETGPGHLSGTFDAKGEFEAGFKGSADFIDATGDRVKLTSYSKRDDTVTTVVTIDGSQSTGLTSYTRKLNGNMPIDNHTEPSMHIPSYTQVDHQVKPVVAIDGPMSAHAPSTSSSRATRTDVSVVSAQSHQPGILGGSYVPSSSINHVGYAPSNASGNSFPHTGYDGQYRRKQRHTPPISPKDPEKAALYIQNSGLTYHDPPAYGAYDNAALSIDKRATLPITSAPTSKEKLVARDEDESAKKKKNRSSYYVESHV